jgi:hypothetical protein
VVLFVPKKLLCDTNPLNLVFLPQKRVSVTERGSVLWTQRGQTVFVPVRRALLDRQLSLQR